MELAQITHTLAQSEERYQDLAVTMQRDVVTYDQQSVQGLTIDQAVEAWQCTKARLVEASQERKLLDLVADKRRDAQRADAARQEQRTMDEVASRRHSTRRESHS
jgi:flagellar biosynthesis chaperone FliJ